MVRQFSWRTILICKYYEAIICLFTCCSDVGFFAVFLMYLNGSRKEKYDNLIFKSRKYIEMSFEKVQEFKFDNSPYRILPGNDSILVCVDSFTYHIDTGLNAIKEITLPFGRNQGNYYVFNRGDTLSGVNSDLNIVFFSKGAELTKSSSQGSLTNGILLGDSLFVFRMNLGRREDLFLDIWSASTNKWVGRLNFRDLLKDKIGHCTECFTSTLECNFFRIGENAFGVYFYRGGYFLTYQNGVFNVTKSVIDIPFIKYDYREVDYGGKLVKQCFSKSDTWVQLSATGLNGKAMILSNIIGKHHKDRCIDIYTKGLNEYLYEHSYSIPKFQGSLPTEILTISAEHLFVLYENNYLVKYKLSQN